MTATHIAIDVDSAGLTYEEHTRAIWEYAMRLKEEFPNPADAFIHWAPYIMVLRMMEQREGRSHRRVPED
ncbi:MAG: hypothetical protein ACRDJE_07305 [Dehalococcoidia bacterium]